MHLLMAAVEWREETKDDKKRQKTVTAWWSATSVRRRAVREGQTMILTLRELASHLRVNERTIQRMLKSGQLKGVKIGGQWRFNGSEIDRLFFPDAEAEGGDAVPLNELVRSHLSIPVSRLLREDRMVLDMGASDVSGVIDELVAPIAGRSLLLDAGDLRGRLLAREELLSTGVGRGIAIPHPRDPLTTLREPCVMVFGRHRAGVEYGAVDGLPARLFFLVCSQTSELHLHLMGKLAQLLRQHEVADLCLECETARDVVRVVLDAERRLFLARQ